MESVLTELQPAPLGEGLRGTSRVLRRMTLAPGALGPADARRVLAAGVSGQALRDAIEVSAGFNLITRCADTIGARPHSARGLTSDAAIAYGGRLIDNGYA